MKRTTLIFTIITTLVMLFSLHSFADEAGVKAECFLGDADANGYITAADARLVLRAAVGLEKVSADTKLMLDADGDSSVTAADARYVLRVAVGLEKAPAHRTAVLAAKEPTCSQVGLTKGSYCTVCGKTVEQQQEIPVVPHSYISYVKEATCTENGCEVFTCIYNCGDTYSDNFVPAPGHSFTTDKILVSADCTKQGSVRNKCTVCGVTEIQSIAALGHTLVGGQTVMPTCIKTGTTAGSYCSVCNEVFEEPTVIPALGHTTITVPGTPATCIKDGYEDSVECAVCGYKVSGGNLIKAEGHKEVTDNYIQPTCTETGLTQGSHCSVCGLVIRERRTIAATGHNEVTVKGYSALCTLDGKTDGTRCSVCGATVKEGSVIPAKGHTPKKVSGFAATCTENGGSDYFKCTVCNKVTTPQEIIPSPGHDYQLTKSRKDATCDAPGYEAEYTCSVCKEKTGGDKLNATGHSYGEVVVYTPATCTKDGENRQTCAVCGTVKVIFVSKTGHAYAVRVVDPTCLTDGYTLHSCVLCGDKYTTDKTLKTGHDYKAVVTPSGCFTDGYTTHTCNNCSDAYTDSIVKAAHTYGEGVVTDPTCETEGYTTYICTVCSYESKAETVSALGHRAGYKKNGDGATHSLICERCNTVFADDEKCIFTEVVAEMSCTETGYTKFVCNNCGRSYKGNSIPATGHTGGTPVKENLKASTCSVSGKYELAVYCTDCGAEVSRETKVLPLSSHSPAVAVNENIIFSGCETNGSGEAVVYCRDCHIEISRTPYTTAPAGHKPVTVKGYTPGCVTTGLSDGTKCSVCDIILTEQTVIPAKGHTPSTVKEVSATCTQSGISSYDVCSVCKEQLTSPETIAPLGHAELVIPGKAATCTENGETDMVICSRCGTEIRAKSVIMKLGHTYGEKYYDPAPGCTTTGFSKKTCIRCDDTQVFFEKALGHNYEKTVIAPSCTEEGYTINKCSVCGDTFNDAVTSATGHSLEYIANSDGLTHSINCSVCDAVINESENCSFKSVVTAPSCTEEGFTTNTCSLCGGTHISDKTSATGHTPGEATKENIVASTCTESGSYDSVVYCTVCKTQLSKEKVVTQATGHTPGRVKEENLVGATCTQPGSCDMVKRCTVCDAVLSTESVIINEKGHSPAPFVTENVTSSACETGGSYDIVIYCSVCGEELERNHIELDAKGHTPGEEYTEIETPATCTTAGTGKKIVKCIVCDKVISSETEVIPATGHTPGEEVRENFIDSTCTEAGSYDAVVYCTVCETELSRQFTEVELKEHSLVTDEAVEATCTETGLTSGTHCSVCGTIIQPQTETEALGHSFCEWIHYTDEDGRMYHKHVCSECDFTEDAFCEYEVRIATDGRLIFVCVVCGNEIELTEYEMN